MTHTRVASLTVDFEANLDGGRLDTVFFAPWRAMGVGVVGAWDTINLDRPFDYNGIDNLLVEVTWSGVGEGDEDAVLQYGFSPDGTYRRAWYWDRQALTAERADNHAYNTLIGFEGAGIVEVGSGRPPRAVRTTIARGILLLGADLGHDPFSPDGNRSCPASLLDASGRKVMALHPGENDISHLAPGIYFVWTQNLRARVVVPR